MLKLIIFFALATALCAAQQPEPGICQTIPVLQGFNVARYLGKWYEIERYDQIAALSTDCVTATYTGNEDGSVKVVNRAEQNGTPVEAIGVAVLADPNATPLEAKLMVSFYNAPYRINYQVLDTDYDTFALVWNCDQVTANTKLESMWVLSRSESMINRPQRLEALINQYLDRSKIRTTRQFGCSREANRACPSHSMSAALWLTTGAMIRYFA